MPVKKKAAAALAIPRLEMGSTTVWLEGRTGLICHRMGAKAKRQLLLGGRKKTAAEKLKLKHHPEEEYRDSMHIVAGAFADTDVVFPASAVKSAMATAALVVEGIKSTDVKRLVYVPEEWIPVYGVPQLRMDVTRSADIGKTPDIRTRAYFPEWTTCVTIEFAKPALSEKAIVALLANAGIMCGIGDFRQEKGKGNFGTWVIGSDGGKPAYALEDQRDAIKDPRAANEETRRLYEEYHLAIADGRE